MFYEQLKKLCEKNGTSPSSITVLLGFSKGTMSNWKKGATPNGDIVVRFAEHFNVSTDFLLLGKETDIPPQNSFTDDELEVLQNYRALDSCGQHQLYLSIYKELDRIKAEKILEDRPIPFAASGEANITPENYEKIQQKLKQFDKRARELQGR